MSRTVPAWDEYHLAIAETVKSRSRDADTQIGCVIVGPGHEVRSTGYNSLPRNVRDDVAERVNRPTKYPWMVHAEANAIANAARSGASLEGCTAYLTPPHFCCSSCAALLINAGIKRVVAPYPDTSNPAWSEPFRIALEMFAEAGVKLDCY